MSKAGSRILEGAREALAVAKGEAPAASITVNGHRYVPADRIASLEREVEELRERCAAWAGSYGSKCSEAEQLRGDMMEIQKKAMWLRGDQAYREFPRYVIRAVDLSIRSRKPTEAEGREGE